MPAPNSRRAAAASNSRAPRVDSSAALANSLCRIHVDEMMLMIVAAEIAHESLCLKAFLDIAYGQVHPPSYQSGETAQYLIITLPGEPASFQRPSCINHNARKPLE
jgi:hypothetical protein